MVNERGATSTSNWKEVMDRMPRPFIRNRGGGCLHFKVGHRMQYCMQQLGILVGALRWGYDFVLSAGGTLISGFWFAQGQEEQSSIQKQKKKKKIMNGLVLEEKDHSERIYVCIT